MKSRNLVIFCSALLLSSQSSIALAGQVTPGAFGIEFVRGPRFVRMRVSEDLQRLAVCISEPYLLLPESYEGVNPPRSSLMRSQLLFQTTSNPDGRLKAYKSK
jgi:hypothetical protein